MSAPEESAKVDIDLESGETQPLKVELPDEPELKGPLKPVAETTQVEKAAALTALLTIITSLIAIMIGGHVLAFFAGLTAIVLGPYLYYQQTQLTDIATLQETTARVEEEVNKFQNEVGRLEKANKEIGATIDDLQDVEETLQAISEVEGQNVSLLEEQVEEARNILGSMKKQSKGRVIQNLISIIERGDEDVDEVISEEEATNVVKGFREIGGLKFDEEKLREKITGSSFEAVVDLVTHLLKEDLPEEERIFELEDMEDVDV